MTPPASEADGLHSRCQFAPEAWQPLRFDVDVPSETPSSRRSVTPTAEATDTVWKANRASAGRLALHPRRPAFELGNSGAAPSIWAAPSHDTASCETSLSGLRAGLHVVPF